MEVGSEAAGGGAAAAERRGEDEAASSSAWWPIRASAGHWLADVCSCDEQREVNDDSDSVIVRVRVCVGCAGRGAWPFARSEWLRDAKAASSPILAVRSERQEDANRVPT
jgi:hypothetical protein